MILIDQLPVEILMKIFRELPSYGRVSLVNKRFYDVACSVNDSKICVKFIFNSFWLENPKRHSIMDSIQKTQRKVTKVSICYDPAVIRPSHLWELAFSDTVQIVKKFYATIKFLELKRVWIEIPEFLEIIALTPNVEHIHLQSVFLSRHGCTKYQLNNECLKLDRLKTLELFQCSKKFLVVFNRLPAGVLKEFTMEYSTLDFNVLTDFFKKQSNIKKLTLNDDNAFKDRTLPDHIFDHLKLESLLCSQCSQNDYNSRHADILCKQTQLASLSLGNEHLPTQIDESVLIVITNQLSEIETLEVTVEEALAVQFCKGITKLKKLKDLTLDRCNLKIIEAFSGLHFSRITSLNLWRCDGFDDGSPMPINIIASLANSVPNLKVLRFDVCFRCPSIVAIMKHFNFVEVLEMKFHKDINANYLSQTIEMDRCFNPKLIKLKITDGFLCEESILKKLNSIYPNLKKLNIWSTRFPSILQFKLILSGFNKMVSLNLHFHLRKLDAEYVDCIKDYKNNLKTIRLHCVWCDEFSAEPLKKLSAVFDVIRYKGHNLYMTN